MPQHKLQADPARTPLFSGNERIRSINAFLETPRYILMIGLLTVAANLLHAELLVYTLFVGIACYISLFGNDFSPLCIIFLSCYITPAAANNPGRAEGSIFYPQNGGIYLLILAAAFVGCTIYRLVKDKELGGKQFFVKPRRFLRSMLVLGGAYMLAGLFSGRYFIQGNILFAFTQVVSLIGLYFLFSGTIRWDRIDGGYWAWIGFTLGLTVCFELIGLYFLNHVIVSGTIITAKIYSGWGNANNIGCMITMMIPFALVLGRQTKRMLLFSLIAIFMLICVCFTCSRTSILVAFPMYLVSTLFILQEKAHKRFFLYANLSILVIALLVMAAFYRGVSTMFRELLDRGLNPRNREIIYPRGIEAFLRHPIFGESFFPIVRVDAWSTLAQMKSFLPSRWHNTVIQLLASCGIVGLVCYANHRLQTIRFFWQRRRRTVLFIGFSILALLLMSLLDCHFFNLGPTMFYSMILAFAEFSPEVSYILEKKA